MKFGGARSTVLALAVLISGGLMQAQAASAAGGTSDQAVAYQIDQAHDGGLFGDSLTLPLAKQWSRTDLGGTVSYPLIAGGKVFVTVTSTSTATSYPPKWIYALDENTGATIWSQAISGTYGFVNAAYDSGSLFVLNFDGLLERLDASTGATQWTKQLPLQYAFTSPPTAANGVVYVTGSGSGGTLYAVSETDGSILWVGSLNTGDHTSPTLSSNSVFVSVTCNVYAFSQALSGTQTLNGYPVNPALWNANSGCSGGGGSTSVMSTNGLYTRGVLGGSDVILDPGTGTTVGSFASGPAPALSGTTGFFTNAGQLHAAGSSGTTLWTFAGDGGLDTAPIVVNNDVYVGSSSGTLYAVDATSGQGVWSTSVGTAIQAPDERNATLLTGLGAGEGHLLVPAGSTLTAYVSGTPDTTPPSISYSVNGPQGNNGWYTGATTVSWTVSDPETGIASSSGCGTTTISADTSGTTLTCTATNGAGLTSSSSVTVKVDATPPALNCGTPPSAWSASDISVACSPTDNTSGVATADGYFTLSTSVPVGTETASAGTPSRQVCDLAGNCATAGPFSGLKVDKLAPSISLTAPVATTYTFRQNVAASYSCSDGGSGVARCAGTVASGSGIDTGSVGARTFTVRASDNVGNISTPASVSYTVTYGVCQSTIPQIKIGHTGTVTVNLCDASGTNVSSSAITVTAAGIYSSSTGTKVRSLTNNFSYKSGSGYTESVNTSGLTSGSYYVAFTATNDPVTHQAQFTVK